MRMAEEAGYSYVDRLAQLEEELYVSMQKASTSKRVHIRAECLNSNSRHNKSSMHHGAICNLSKLFASLKTSKRITSLYLRDTLNWLLQLRLGLNDQELVHNLMRYINEANTGCLVAATCYSSKYRMIDGSCNSVNVNLTRLGQSVTTYRRLLAPAYLDGMPT